MSNNQEEKSMDLRFIDPRSITEQMKGKEGDFMKLLDAAREIRRQWENGDFYRGDHGPVMRLVEALDKIEEER